MTSGRTFVQRAWTRAAVNVKNAGRFARFWAGGRRRADFAKTVYLDLREPRMERYYYLLAKFFELAGWQVCIRFDPVLLLNLRNYSEFIYDIAGLRFVRSRPSRTDLELSLAAGNTSIRRVQVDLNYFRKDRESDAFVFPYPMHPDVYHFGIADRLESLRSEPKQIRVFFGGNTGEPYVNADIEQIFGMANRKIVTDILDAMPGMLKIASHAAFEEAMSAREPKMLLLGKNVALDIEEWMRTLARSDFFIAAPGVSMPFSHNVIEAMAVGTIPVLQYGELFAPPLTDGVNCIVFDSENDLVERLEYCRDLSPDAVAGLRKGVLDYYDTYLAPKAVIDRLSGAASSISTMYVNAEHLSILRYKDG